jgi:hypothetical protein
VDLGYGIERAAFSAGVSATSTQLMKVTPWTAFGS